MSEKEEKMTNFATIENVYSPTQKLSKIEMLRAIKFAITSDYGNVQLYGLNGVRAIGLFPNQNTVSVCDSSGNQTILLDGNTGNVYAANFVQT
jgi:hypothetical protein